MSARYRDEKLEMFQDKEVTIPFVTMRYSNTMKAKILHHTIYFTAFITLLVIEGYLTTLLPAAVNDFLNSNQAVSLGAGIILLLLNYGILHRYMNYAEEKISDAKIEDQDAEDTAFRAAVEDSGYTMSRHYSFKNAWSALYTDKEGVTYNAAAGHYDGKELHLVLVAD